MSITTESLRKDEQLIFELKNLYNQYGYKKFKMSKFEEYDLYLENKKFLLTDNIITFNDHNGRLLALKPDITLSIVKNTNEKKLLPNKLYYSENVYRSAKDENEIKELMQMGIEYIGDADLYATSEVLLLAVKSLESISKDFILGISHMGIVTGLLNAADISLSAKESLSKCISEKNADEIKIICEENEISTELTEKLVSLSALYGPFESVIASIEDLAVNQAVTSATEELKSVYGILKELGVAENIRLDFSIMNDMNYYNGIIFQGFISSIPSSILSGGRYDNLVRKLGKNTNAIGFAIYLNLLERYYSEEKPYDVDVLIIYDENTEMLSLVKEVKLLTDKNLSVRVQKNMPDNLKYGQLLTMKNGRLEKIETCN